jgi:hypothetical protein
MGFAQKMLVAVSACCFKTLIRKSFWLAWEMMSLSDVRTLVFPRRNLAQG